MKKTILWTLTMLLLIGVASAENMVSDADFYFDFEDAGSSLTNYGDEPYNATWSTASYNTSVPLEGDQSGWYTGSNYFSVNPSDTYSYDNFLYSAWVYMTVRDGEHRLFEHRSASTSRLMISLKNNDRLELRGLPNIEWYEHGVDIPKGEWVHIVVWKNETHAEVWANSTTNGVESYQETGSFTGLTSSDAQDMYFGYSAYDSGRHMKSTAVDCVQTYYGDINATSVAAFQSSTCENITTPPTSSPLGLSDGLVLNMTFQENSSSTAIDYSPYSNNGTVTGATWSSNRSGSYSFDGVNDYLSIFNGVDNSYTSLTANVWIYKNLNHTGDVLKQLSMFRVLSVGSDIKVCTLNSSVIYGEVCMIESLPALEWNMVTYVVTENEGAKLYVNNVLTDSSTDARFYDFQRSSDDLFIGTANGYEYFNGFIDDVLVYNRSLNSSEILSLYESGLESSSPVVSGNVSSSTVINLTFDNILLNDTAGLHTWSTNGAVSHATGDECLWYDCANFTVDYGDYLSTVTNFTMDGTFGLSYWIKPTSGVSGGSSQAYWQIGNNENLDYQYQEEGDYGINSRYRFATTYDSWSLGSSQSTDTNVWNHHCQNYDGTYLTTYKDGILYSNRTIGETWNYTNGNDMDIGHGIYGIDLIGYMDEFILVNNSGLDCIAQYDAHRLGNPPALDVYVSNITYTMPWNWSHPKNFLQTNVTTLPITITLANAGINDANNYEYSVIANGSTIQTGSLNTSAESSSTITVNWNVETGWIPFTINIDINDDLVEEVEAENNIYSFYIPYQNRPWAFPTDLTDTKDYCYNSSNALAYQGCDWIDSFVSEDFNGGWTCADVDPRGKKGWENAMGCYLNEFPSSSTQCDRAYNYLDGWGNLDGWGTCSVQAINELIWVGQNYDLMFQNFTEAEYLDYSEKYYNICQDVINHDDSGIQQDEIPRNPTGGNGQGFGSGIFSICDYVLGTYSQNPTLINIEDSSYWGKNNNYMAWNRISGYLKARHNDSDSKNQERTLYKFYGENKIMSVIWMLYQNGVYDYANEYNNAFCGMANEFIVDALDKRYDGGSLRGDESRNFRFVSMGDSNSYEDPSSGTVNGWGILTYYGLMCNDPEVKNMVFQLRQLGRNIGDSDWAYPEIYTYQELEESVTDTNYDMTTYRKVFFDKGNEILTLRDNYTYEYDTMIQIDGGQHKLSGHPNAQGYFFYYKGYPFIDYTQVPYNDNVRAETFQNTISFINESDSYGYPYISGCGEAPAYQGYGDGACSVEGTYADFNWGNTTTLGQVKDYMGSKNAYFGGALNIIPMKNTATPINEHFIKVGDSLFRYVEVVGSPTNKILDTNLNLDTDINVSGISGDKITLQAFDNDTYMEIDVLYTTTSGTLYSEDSGVQYGFTKTGSPTGKGNYRRIFYQINTASADYIRSYSGYQGSANAPSITIDAGTDRTITNGNYKIAFDTSKNGITTSGNYETDGWGLIYNEVSEEYLCYGCTYLEKSGTNIISSTNEIQAYIDVSEEEYKLEFNTMDRVTYVDSAVTTNVSINAEYLTNSTGLIVTNDAQSISVIETPQIATFTIDECEQYGCEYSLTGNNISNFPYPSIIIQNVSDLTETTGTFYVETNKDSNASWNYGVTTSLGTVIVNGTFQNTTTGLITGLSENTVYYYNLTLCNDVSSECYTYGQYDFTTTCTPTWTNTTWSNWTNTESCQTNDNLTQIRYLTQYDADNCPSSTNTTFNQTQEIACDYCQYNNTNTTWSGWSNTESCQTNDYLTQIRTLTEYDINYDTCYAITGLASDLWNSGNNITHNETQEVTCNYCSYSTAYTDWTNYSDTELCDATGYLEMERTRIQYDENADTCYAITGLASDLWNSGNNITETDNVNVGCVWLNITEVSIVQDPLFSDDYAECVATIDHTETTISVNYTWYEDGIEIETGSTSGVVDGIQFAVDTKDTETAGGVNLTCEVYAEETTTKNTYLRTWDDTLSTDISVQYSDRNIRVWDSDNSQYLTNFSITVNDITTETTDGVAEVSSQELDIGTTTILAEADGYADVTTTLTFTNYSDLNRTINMSLAQIILTFSEQVELVFDVENCIEAYDCQGINTTNITLNVTDLSKGYVKARLNPDGSEGWQQIYEFYNDWQTDFSANILVETVDLEQNIKVKSEELPITSAQVCASKLYENQWWTTFCDYTDSVGEATIILKQLNNYKFCANKEGYDEECEIFYIPPNNQDTYIINIFETGEQAGVVYINQNCENIYDTTKVCTVKIFPYDDDSTICIQEYREGSARGSPTCVDSSSNRLFAYDISTLYNNYTFDITYNGEIIHTIIHEKYTNEIDNDINFETEDEDGNTWKDKLQENTLYFIIFHIFMVIIGVATGMLTAKYFKDKAEYGMALFWAVIGFGGLYIFLVPVAIITIKGIVEALTPLFR